MTLDMTVGGRIKARLEQIGMSQSELARRVGVRQSTINQLIHGDSRSSRYLHLIARELGTTIAYLIGETDDPDADVPPKPPAPPYQAITMQVLLPAEDALARMFEALLAMVDPAAPPEAQARSLARNLPVGLSQLRDLLPSPAPAARAAKRRGHSKTLVEQP